MHYFILILFSFFYASDQPPLWAKDLVLTDTTNVYSGIGFSKDSKEEAKDKAFTDFAESIKLTISSQTVVSASEKTKGRVTKGVETFESDIKTITEEELRGVNITQYWEGNGAQGEGHYILVVYDIDEYHANNEKLIAEEIKRNEEKLILAKQENRNEQELLKQKMELEQLKLDNDLQIEKNKQKRAELREGERDRKRSEKEKREKRRNDRERKLKNKYPDFPNGNPPYRLIDSFVGESSNNTHSIIAKGTITPTLINELGYTYQWKEKKLNVSANAIMDKIKTRDDQYENHFDYMKNHIKFDFFGTKNDRIAGSLGLAQYIYNDNDKNEESSEIFFEHSFFMSANYGFWAYLTDVGGYVDKESVYLNFIHYPLYGKIQERLAVMLEFSCLFDERLRDNPERKYGLQFGVLFKTSDTLITKFTYENYEDLMLSIEFDL